MNSDDALQLLRRLAKALGDRQTDIKTWRAYYDGDQPLKFATPEYRVQFEHQYDGFRDNWCAPVADAVPEKLSFVGLKLPREKDGEPLAPDVDFARIWAENEAPAESSMAWTEASIAKRAFALVWGEGDDERTPEITFEAADEAIVEYEPGSRRKRRSGLKMWQQDENWIYATLYTRAGLYLADDPAYVWKFKRRSATFTSQLWTPSTIGAGGWEPREVNDEPWPLENPSGVVPLVELPNRPRLVGDPISEIAGVAPMQDAVNVLWSYLFTAADFAALPQRVLLGAQLPKIPILDRDGQPTGAYKTAEELIEPVLRKRIAAFAGDNAKIDQWDPADLDAFTKVIEFAVGHIAAQSRTSVDRFFTGGTIANVNADGLKAMNESERAKVAERSIYYAGGIREIAATSYLMLGDEQAAARARAATVEWDDFELRSEAAIGDWMLKLKQSDFSFEFRAAQLIKDPVELAAEVQRHDAEMAAAAAAFDFGPKPDPNAQ